VIDAGELCDTTDLGCASCRLVDGFRCSGAGPGSCWRLFRGALPAHVDPRVIEGIQRPPDLTIDCNPSPISTDVVTPTLCGTTVPASVATGSPDLWILFVRNLRVLPNNALRITGDRAVVIVASGDVEIAGTLDVGSLSSTAGPGAADPASAFASCAGRPSDSAAVGGGGGGASQAGGNGAGVLVADNRGFAAPRDLFVSPLFGGCHGGGVGAAGGGGGGGALQISAAGSLRFTGVLLAGGGPGQGGVSAGSDVNARGGGGGGGGSGGTLLLEGSPVVTASGNVNVNGGGGGGGGNTTASGGVGRPGNSGGGGGAAADGAGGGGGCCTQQGGGADGGTSSIAGGGGGAGARGFFATRDL
jgi:hypothetical protein